MAWAWNPWALPGLAAAVVAAILAWILYATRPRGAENRAAAIFVATSGIFSGTLGLRLLARDPASAYALWAVGIALIVFPGFLSLAVLLRGLPTSLAAPLRVRGVVPGLGLASALIVALALGSPTLMARDLVWVDPPGVYILRAPSGLFQVGNVVLILLYLGGAAVAVAAWWNERDALRRKRAGYLALALASYLGLVGAALAYLRATGLFGSDSVPTADQALINFLSVPTGTLLLVIFLAYGILSAQLFDIDVRLRWTVRQSTVAAAFLGVFFVATEAAQQFLGETLGSAYVGIVAAGALVFALAPLQRLAERFAKAAVRGPRSEAEREARRLAIYRAAVASAARDGVITERERDVLATLQEELGISATEALAIEREERPAPPT